MGKEGYVITLVTHPEEIKKLKKFTSLREIVLKKSRTLYQIKLRLLYAHQVYRAFLCKQFFNFSSISEKRTLLRKILLVSDLNNCSSGN